MTVFFGVYRLLAWNVAQESMIHQQDVMLGDVSSCDGFQVAKMELFKSDTRKGSTCLAEMHASSASQLAAVL